ncbi:MAG TPA: hypothetical protein VGF13_21120 [Verrucomicrobiae bacterium]|jgi:hypothetical protein
MSSGLQPSKKKAWLLLVAPVVFLCLHALFSQARGPFFLPLNYDPDYAYLLNGLNIVNGAAPEHLDHPGTSLQLFAAACIKLANIRSSSDATIMAVLAGSESYLRAMNSALMSLYALALLFVGAVVWRKTGSIAAALLLQVTPFLLPEDFYEIARFRPESIILIVVFLMAATLYIHALREDRESLGSIVWMSFLVATGLITKINFLPLVLLPLFCLRSWRNRAGYIVLTGTFAAIWLLPLKPRFKEFIVWTTGLITRQGRYGTGEPGFLPPHYFEFLAQLFVARPMFFLTLWLSLAALAYAWGWRRKGTNPQEARLIKLLIGVVVVQIGEYLMVGKFEQARYLIPAMALCGLNWVILLTLIRHWGKKPIELLWLRLACISAGSIFAVWSGLKTGHACIQMANVRDEHRAMARELETNFADKTVVYYYGCSSRYHALWFGNTYAGHRYGKVIIAELFPNHSPAYIVEELPHRVNWYSVAGPDIPLKQRIEQGETIFLAGQEWPAALEKQFFVFLPNDVSIDKVRAQAGEAIYRVKRLSPL